MSDPAPPCLLELRTITRRFPGVLALHRVDVRLNAGEVLAVIGENGAGKSTLMKILAGVHRPDTGQILIDGRPVRIESVRAATKLGIVLIHQELNLADNLTVGANIFLGREPHRFGLIDRRRIRRNAQATLNRVGLAVPPRRLVGTLSIGQRQMVEIARALSADARILIMDEPTSSLSDHESDQLFDLIGQLRGRGVSIIYISHRLGEVDRLADRVLVLRDGRNAGELNRTQISHDAMVKLMVGRDIKQFYSRRPHREADPVLEVENLVTPAHPREKISFALNRGEVVGLAGLVGAGRTELLRVLFGVEAALSGRIRVAGSARRFRSPSDAIRAGVALVPEDRRQHGLLLESDVRDNLGLAALRLHARPGGVVNRAAQQRIASDMINALNVRTPGPRQIVQHLSGGNQQKVVLGKWLTLRPRILLLDEPTRGIDVGAKQEIYRLMEKLADEGVAILFASSETEEIIGMSQRVLVMHEGRIGGDLNRSELNEQTLMRLATGGSHR